MSMLDEAGMKTIEHLDQVTIPLLVTAMNELVTRLDKLADDDIKSLFDGAHDLLDRINRARATINFEIPESKTK